MLKKIQELLQISVISLIAETILIFLSIKYEVFNFFGYYLGFDCVKHLYFLTFAVLVTFLFVVAGLVNLHSKKSERLNHLKYEYIYLPMLIIIFVLLLYLYVCCYLDVLNSLGAVKKDINRFIKYYASTVFVTFVILVLVSWLPCQVTVWWHRIKSIIKVK